MNRPASKSFRAHDARREPDESNANVAPRVAKTDPSPAPEDRSAIHARPAAHHRRITELEAQLAEALDALARQKQESEENATSFSQAMARLSHSERTLGQTKAKLMDAEERLERAEARAAALSAQLSQAEQALEGAREREHEQRELLATLRADDEAKTRELEAAHESASRARAQETALRDLAESLSRDSAEGAAECARLNESCKAAEEREQRTLERAFTAEASLASAQAALALAQQQLAHADHERTRFVGTFGALETLGREIAEVGFQARKAAESRSQVESALTEFERATLRPDPAVKPEPRSLRSQTAPEITVDGVRLDP